MSCSVVCCHTIYAKLARLSITPERLLRAPWLVCCILPGVSGRSLEDMDSNLLFRWSVGLNVSDEVWGATTFPKNRDRLLEADLTKGFLAQVRQVGELS
jgi:Transposase domain (DUF772)